MAEEKRELPSSASRRRKQDSFWIAVGKILTGLASLAAVITVGFFIYDRLKKDEPDILVEYRMDKFELPPLKFIEPPNVLSFTDIEFKELIRKTMPSDSARYEKADHIHETVKDILMPAYRDRLDFEVSRLTSQVTIFVKNSGKQKIDSVYVEIPEAGIYKVSKPDGTITISQSKGRIPVGTLTPSSQAKVILWPNSWSIPLT